MLDAGAGRRARNSYTLECFTYPHSLGFLWEQLSIYLGFSPYDASKVMGLAAYGDPEVFREQFASIVAVSEDSYSVDSEAIDFKSIEMQRLQALLGPMRDMDEEILPHHKHVAAALQVATDAAVIALVRRLERSVGGRRLCLSGGVALNCVTNSLISRMTGYSEIFIPSAPHDAGTAIGAALMVHCAERGARWPIGGASPYLGPEFSDREAMAAVKAAGPQATEVQGHRTRSRRHGCRRQYCRLVPGPYGVRTESAGNRSLLADPRGPTRGRS